ncbi:hypothetical protein M430DRAFT_194937 [Amorphotheca resinae ATCC 22711]|uniref:Uncharacterized protein n=1 Tax=Amorphotheca resinae ATCC 22711 TaxID=857342 RepID=A0A2T3AP70_AMORE|nr:hypothetical protein M430DRAFT_194937 [Amorphotheca resinae ATCC 22711]PSS06700.1 hypothetical protein M430DRAFT_194937 [Amorphotheca resinae ATCC 22711]
MARRSASKSDSEGRQQAEISIQARHESFARDKRYHKTMEELLGRIDLLLEHSQRLIDILHMIANHVQPPLPLPIMAAGVIFVIIPARFAAAWTCGPLGQFRARASQRPRPKRHICFQACPLYRVGRDYTFPLQIDPDHLYHVPDPLMRVSEVQFP